MNKKLEQLIKSHKKLRCCFIASSLAAVAFTSTSIYTGLDLYKKYDLSKEKSSLIYEIYPQECKKLGLYLGLACVSVGSLFLTATYYDKLLNKVNEAIYEALTCEKK